MHIKLLHMVTHVPTYATHSRAHTFYGVWSSEITLSEIVPTLIILRLFTTLWSCRIAPTNIVFLVLLYYVALTKSTRSASPTKSPSVYRHLPRPHCHPPPTVFSCGRCSGGWATCVFAQFIFTHEIYKQLSLAGALHEVFENRQ